jgi:hypothetical protein
MPPAVAVAGITAAATIGGAVLSNKAQKKASKQAANVAQNTAAANNTLARDIYGQNAARLDPYSARGQQAGGALMGLLGYGSPPPTAAPAMGGAGGDQTDWAGYVRANPDAMSDWQRFHRDMSLEDYGQYHWSADGGRRDLTPFRPQTATAPATGTPGATPQQGALDAFNTFRNSTNYQWRFNEGNKALQMSALGGGGFDSGATRKALTEYGQNFASNELGTYMDRLAQQQQLGLGAASALAGVGQNFVGQVSANNNSAGTAAANAALMQGNARANMWGGIAGGIGQAIGALGSSYGGGGGGGYASYGGGWGSI